VSGVTPSFVLSGPSGTLVAEDIVAGYDDPAAAADALRSGSAPIILGALPFNVSQPAALNTPRLVNRSQGLPDWAPGADPHGRTVRSLPSPEEHRARVGEAIRRLREPGTALQKVVLARALELVAEIPWDACEVVRRLAAADPSAYAYLVDLSPAGGDYLGTALVGASPELLVERHGNRVLCRPFAGSAPRAADPDTDLANAAALAESGKNRHEHQLVVDAIAEALAPLCSDLDVGSDPTLHHTDALWHLGTSISGTLDETSTTAMDLALLLHPTPAVGGAPTDAAAAVITELEGDRGFYAGAVGWCDTAGDGRWVVAIRGALLSADRRRAVAHSGGGIVAASDPTDEVDETTAKFRTILSGLGVPL
jgi:isochorismate synthase